MAWPRGHLARVVVDLLLELGGGPEGPGVTIAQLMHRVMSRPPAGIFYSATIQYATAIRNLHGRRGDPDRTLEDFVLDDGAQGTTIKINPETGRLWFTREQAVRKFLVHSLNMMASGSDWLIRIEDRWRLASAERGPLIPGLGIYNAAAREGVSKVERAHSAYVTAMGIAKDLNGQDGSFAEALLRASIPTHGREPFDKHRTRYKRMLDAYRRLDADQLRNVRQVLVDKAGGAG